MNPFGKRILSLTAGITLCVSMMAGTIPGASAEEAHGGCLDLTNTADWDTTSAAGMETAFEVKDGALKLNHISGGDGHVEMQSRVFATWENPVLLDLAENPSLDVDLTADNGWNVSFLVRLPGTKDGFDAKIQLNQYLAKGGLLWGDKQHNVQPEDGIPNYLDVKGTYSLVDMIRFARPDLKIPDTGVIKVFEFRTYMDWVPVDNGLTIRRFRFYSNPTPAKKVAGSLDLGNTAAWNRIDGWGMETAFVTENGALKLNHTAGGDGAATWQSSAFATWEKPVRMDLSANPSLDVDLTADNGWNVTFLVRLPGSPKDKFDVKIELNPYLAKNELSHVRQKGDGRLWGDETGNVIADKGDMQNYLDVKGTFSLLKMMRFARPDLEIPAAGVIEVFEFRTFMDWVPVNNGLTIRKFDFVQDVAALQGHSITLADSIGVNFMVNSTMELHPDDYMQFTVPSSKEPIRVAVKDAGTDKSGNLVFTCPMVAKEMTDTIHAEMVVGGKVLFADDYSVSEYAACILNTNHGYSAKAREAVRSMLNYGAAAQTYFGYHTERLANAGLSDQDKTPKATADAFAGFGYQAPVGAVSGLTYTASSLNLKSATGLFHYFTLAPGADISDYRFELVTEGKTVELAPVSRRGMQAVEITGIHAAGLDKAYTLRVTKGAETMTVTYSPYTYANLTAGSKAPLTDLMLAMADYCDAANAYRA